ncbi:hypothetical protein OCU04_005159 [Sclerotinia nivalis]|uniref:Heterokaryon incompatibility domain-containing protein n=1 Tax=Sclerotinia nivalis TaxID=352851 RepID=A0A9X0ANK0_9HELO|nr:hypothetical protein OCU04_005159 [Sclerotinia nivalis]
MNQNDLHELASQTQNMAEIYSGAENLIIWLGLEQDNSDLTIEPLKNITSNVERDWINWTMKPKSEIRVDEKLWSVKRILIEDILEMAGVSSLNSFLKRSLFQRLWIWQEVHLARQATIVCGGDIMGWSSFRSSMFLLTHQFTWDQGRASLLATAFSIFDTDLMFGFMKIFRKTQHAKYSVDRDRVYATFGLMKWEYSHMIKIEADYSKKVSQVYKEFAMANYGKLRNLAIMEHCWI